MTQNPNIDRNMRSFFFQAFWFFRNFWSNMPLLQQSNKHGRQVLFFPQDKQNFVTTILKVMVGGGGGELMWDVWNMKNRQSKVSRGRRYKSPPNSETLSQRMGNGVYEETQSG
jgi:hypothetical protein